MTDRLSRAAKPGLQDRPPERLRRTGGFTILEIIIVLFLLTGLLTIIIPRIGIGETLASNGRKWVSALRTFQEMAVAAQKPVRLHIDLERGQYWPMILQDGEERVPLNEVWQTPVNLPESIHITDVQVGQKKSSAGRAALLFYPNGKIDPVVMHLTDDSNNLLGIQVEPVTATIRVSDQRIEPPRPWTLPERIRQLLQIQQTPPGVKPAAPVAPGGQS
ncbi:MAG: type II secretion system protein [Nitrospira sp.]|nr:type II secretion system protein [Nitrospira sp.]